MRILAPIVLLCFVLLTSFSACADASFVDYMQSKPTKRHALVIANSAYVSPDEPLPGTSVDADGMERALKNLNFDVTKYKNVKSIKEFFSYLRLFAASIEEGDVALVYFSGHGFSYDGETLLMPTQRPIQVENTKLLRYFVSVEAIRRHLNESYPSLALIILDSCRNVPSFIVDEKGQDDYKLSKGASDPGFVEPNTIYWFSTNIRSTSKAYKDERMSDYTKALVENLSKLTPESQSELQDIRRLVLVDTLDATGNTQHPWATDGSSVVFHLSPSKTYLQDLMDLWKAALGTGTRRAVDRYLKLHGTGVYGYSAREWLRTNPLAPKVKTSAVSPATVDAAWAWAGGGPGASLPEISGDIAAPRTKVFLPASEISGVLFPSDKPSPKVDQAAAAAKQTVEEVSRERIAIAASKTADPALASASALQRLDRAVAVEPIDGYSSPSRKARVKKKIKAGDEISVSNFTNKDGDIWLHATTGSGEDVYIQQARTVPKTRELGQSIGEISLLQKSEKTRGIVDTSPLLAFLKKIKSDHKRVTRVSINTPVASNLMQQYTYDLEAVYTTAALIQTGVDRESITIVENSSSASSTTVRIFGKE